MEETLKNDKEQKFLQPESLAKLASVLCDYQRGLFEKVSQASSDTFDPDFYEETAIDLSTIDDAIGFTTEIAEILRLTLNVERKSGSR